MEILCLESIFNEVEREASEGKKVTKITAVEDDKYTQDHFGELVDDSDIQARYPSDSVSIFFPISLNLIN